jgi:hypothetical protein
VRQLSEHYGQLDVYLLTKPVLPAYPLPADGAQVAEEAAKPLPESTG